MNKRVAVVEIIVFAVFNVIAFVIPSSYTATFFTAYAFTTIAFGIELYMLLVFFKKHMRPTSRFYRIPVLYVCNAYIIAQGIAFLIFKFFPEIPTWVSIVASVMILAATLIGLITIESAIDYVEAIDAKVKPKVTFIKTLQAEVELLLSDIKDEEARKAIEKLIEKVKYSDPMSDPSLWEIEREIEKNIEELKRCDDSRKTSLSSETIRKLDERNKKCKLLK